MAVVPDLAALATLPLFHGLTLDDLARVRPLLHATIFPAQSSLMTAEMPGEVLYIVLTGTVKIHVPQPDGTDVIIAFGGPGDIEGEMSLIEAGVRTADVIATEATTALWMDRAAFQESRRTIPVLTDNLARILAGRLRLANQRIQALCTLDINGRVARQLLAFAHYFGQSAADGGLLVPLRLTQSDMASLVGASRERVNRALSFYRERGLLAQTTQGYFSIPSAEALERFCR